MDKKINAKSVLDDLLKNVDTKVMPKVGDLVEARVLNITKGEVYLDIDGLFIGMVRGRELVDESGRFSDLKPGDVVLATVVEAENEKGVLELSFRSAGHLKAWQELEDLRKSGEIVEVKILDANKGGLLIQLRNMQGFLPVSQLSQDNYPRVDGGNKIKILEKLKSFIGKKFKVKVLDVDEKDDKLIVSEKDVFADARKAMVNQFKVGDIVTGRVTSIVDFGAFVEFYAPANPDNKLEGLVHISELAWQRVGHPKDILKVNEDVSAQIIGIDNDRVSLSIKKLTVDPWKKAVEKYQVGEKVNGKILKIDKFGAFVELDVNIQGLAHISELADQAVQNPEEVVKVGESYDFIIMSLDPDEHRLGLSLRAALPGHEKKSVPEEVEKKSEETSKEIKTEVVEN
ncbi:MAG TPA: S1 RNA-binding domain-containing protein [bacterium]|nr:S1 RNA-binding domain-containing protein [bacterium]